MENTLRKPNKIHDCRNICTDVGHTFLPKKFCKDPWWESNELLEKKIKGLNPVGEGGKHTMRK